MKNYFPSAKSTGLGLIIWTIILFPYGWAVYELFLGQITTELLIRLGILSLVILFIGTIWFGTGYQIYKGRLYVKIGPFAHSNIDIFKITEILKTNSWLSAPANSFNRLALKSNDVLLIMVSPKDQEGFIEALKARNPNINIEL